MASNIVPNFSQDDANNIIKFIFDDATIREDGLVNVTALSSAYRRATGKRKDVLDWLKTTRATDSIAHLGRVTGIPVTELVIAEHGIGTWVHSKLAELFAQWCSIEYEFAVVDLIQAAKSQHVKVVQETEQPRRLAPQRDLIDYIEALELAGLLDDPLLKSLIAQRAAEQLGGKALPTTQLVVLTVRAGELGYSAKEIGTGSELGKYVVAYGFTPKGKSPHGKYQVNVYELTRELDKAIHSYFA